jgi:RND family efflux transporter MFP subunit
LLGAALAAALLAVVGVVRWPALIWGAPPQKPPAPPRVDTVKPTRGVLERVTKQPGNTIGDRSVEVVPEVAGYIEEQPVDIDTPVKKGDLLVKIRVPELHALMEKQAAAHELARAQVEEAKAAWLTAQADREAVGEKIQEAKARLKAARSTLAFRARQKERYKELHRLGSIDGRLVDEQRDRYDAAEQAKIAAEAALRSAEFQEKAAVARVDQSLASFRAAGQKVRVAKGEWEHAKSLVGFATIRAPFDGMVTRRNFFRGNFVQAATGPRAVPLLRVDQIDKVRVVVFVPDRDVRYCCKGLPATVVFDHLHGGTYQAAVSRVSRSEDRLTKTMRVEIDLPNADGRITLGAYARVSIVLEKLPNALSIPAAALVVEDAERYAARKGKRDADRAEVFVVHDGKARLREVRTGMNNGELVQVLEGLSDHEEVVKRPGGLADGDAVDARPAASHD